MANDRTKTYTIGELANEFDISSRALRLYEESELLSPTRQGMRRIYSERDRVRLRLILRGKRLGWTLAEVKEVFDLYDSSHGEEAQLVLMLSKLDERRHYLKAQQKDIESSLEDLKRVAANAKKALAEIRSSKQQSKAG